MLSLHFEAKHRFHFLLKEMVWSSIFEDYSTTFFTYFILQSKITPGHSCVIYFGFMKIQTCSSFKGSKHARGRIIIFIMFYINLVTELDIN